MEIPVYLKNGQRVKINDHVYCSPSWAVRDGTPYSIARIMDFLPPEGSPKDPNRPFLYTRVRLAWYYRPGDVSDRPVTDPRLLLAAMYSEICDINQLRDRCYVVHRDKISDLAGWKKRPDRFYFNRLFDPYIKKEFEVIQATDVRNLPDNIRETLLSRYEYVVAEKEVVPDLTDAIRLCDTCQDWCPSPETVQCDRCKLFFHMHCVQPPLVAKPSRGYGWTCAPCSRQHEEEVDSHDVRHLTPFGANKPPRSNAPAPRGRGRPRKDRTQAEKEENLPIKHFNMWPFRYFGQYTVAEDTLDPDDLIFPRTASRLGPKFQANVPLAPGLEIRPDIEERGGDNTIEVLGIINELSEEQLAELEECKRSLTRKPDVYSSVDWLTEVIKRFSDAILTSKPLSGVSMKSPMRSEKWKKETRYTDRDWTLEEKVAFEDAIATHGAELRAVRDDVGSRSIYEVVRYYAHWKNSKLGEENARIREQGSPAKPAGMQYTDLSDASNGQRVGLEDDDESIISHPSRASVCGACRTRESQSWWKAPKGLATDILCEGCAMNWRKYADLNVRPLREESVVGSKNKTSDKREGTPLAGPSAKRARTSASVHSSPPPPSVPQIRCLCCLKNGPIGKVLQCRQCKFRVHAGSCGAIVDPSAVEKWICELCENEKTLEASVNSNCLLCPRVRKIRKDKPIDPPPDNFLRACKPTEGQGWVHVLCSVFIPELNYTDASRLRLVEGMSTISTHRWTRKCYICGEVEGAVIRCGDCTREYHASCAWKHGHRFGFEIQPVKINRRDTTIMVNFKGESGCMVALICCKEHDRSKRDMYDICEMDEGGETALQVYCQAYKQARTGQAHGLLRKARRLDQIMNIRPEVTAAAEPSSEPQCYRCRTEYSPVFYRIAEAQSTVGGGMPQTWLCHKCHFETGEIAGEAIGIAVS